MVELERKSAIGGDRVTVSQHSEAAASTPHTLNERTQETKIGYAKTELGMKRVKRGKTIESG